MWQGPSVDGGQEMEEAVTAVLQAFQHGGNVRSILIEANPEFLGRSQRGGRPNQASAIEGCCGRIFNVQYDRRRGTSFREGS